MPNNDEYDPICELCPHRLADHEKDDEAAVMESLDPHGLFLYVTGVPDRQAGLAMLKRLEQWSQDRSRGIAG